MLQPSLKDYFAEYTIGDHTITERNGVVETLDGLEFKTVQEAVAHINNLEFDEFKIGDSVKVEFKNSRLQRETYTGIVCINTNYSDEFPYRIKIGDDVTYCSSEEVKSDNNS